MVYSAKIGKAILNDLLHIIRVFGNWLVGKASRTLGLCTETPAIAAAFLIGLALDSPSESRSVYLCPSDILRDNPGPAPRQATHYN